MCRGARASHTVSWHGGAALFVREIVLLPIGGVSRLENLPETPSDEFAIAIVGPAASFGLAAAAAIVTVGLREPLLPIDFATGPFLARLMWFNLIIGAFNLLPAFPLDGGRVLRSLLERHQDLERARPTPRRGSVAVSRSRSSQSGWWSTCGS